jgi:polysaccharide biosynthesis protein PslA
MNVETGGIAVPNRVVAVEADISNRPLPKETLRVALYLAMILLDCVSIAIGFLLANGLRFGNLLALDGLNMGMALVPVYLGVALNSRAYGMDVLRSPKVGIYRAIMSFALAVGAVLLFSFYLKISTDFSRLVFSVGAALSLTTIAVARLSFGRYANHLLGGNPLSEVLITDGVSYEARKDIHLIDSQRAQLRPDINDPLMLDRLGRHLDGIDRVVVACPLDRRQRWAMALKGANIDAYILSPELDDLGAIGMSSYSGTTMVRVARGALGLRDRALKRLLDLTLAVFGLFAVAPLMVVVAIAIKLESQGPIFFVQERLGQGNRLFSMYKFRSMRTESCDHAGNQSTRRDDDRITRVGRFIRSSSIDELPQLLNVLLGDMSFVGPRPHALGSLAGDQLFWEVDQRYWHRHACKPGITGLAQVRGYRGATEKRADLTNRLQCDLEYLAGWTIWRDISILFATFGVMTHKNAY